MGNRLAKMIQSFRTIFMNLVPSGITIGVAGIFVSCQVCGLAGICSVVGMTFLVFTVDIFIPITIIGTVMFNIIVGTGDRFFVISSYPGILFNGFTVVGLPEPGGIAGAAVHSTVVGVNLDQIPDGIPASIESKVIGRHLLIKSLASRVIPVFLIIFEECSGGAGSIRVPAGELVALPRQRIIVNNLYGRRISWKVIFDFFTEENCLLFQLVSIHIYVTAGIRIQECNCECITVIVKIVGISIADVGLIIVAKSRLRIGMASDITFNGMIFLIIS